jgi:hypothetical protein
MPEGNCPGESIMQSKTSIVREIRADWKNIVARSGVSPLALTYLPRTDVQILGESTKTTLSESVKVLTAVAYMAPATEAFEGMDSHRTMCAMAGWCADVCLGHNSGMLSMSPSKRARLWKTALFLGSRRLFGLLLDCEIRSLEARASRLGMIPAVRVDGSSDTGYGMTAALRHPDVTFYDYTKVRARLKRSKRIPNYNLTYSWSERSTGIPRGFNVAFVADVSKGGALRKRFRGRPVISGDAHDARFLDPRGVAIQLYFKAAADREGHRELASSFLQA